MKYKISEFAKQIRDLYPGDYDDLTDEQLTRLWLKKYPKDIEKVDLSLFRNKSVNKLNSFSYSKIFAVLVIAFISYGIYNHLKSKEVFNNSSNNTEISNPSNSDAVNGKLNSNHNNYSRCLNCYGKGYKDCVFCNGTRISNYKCSSCHGRGFNDNFSKCFECKGVGFHICSNCNGLGTLTCTVCNGNGELFGDIGETGEYDEPVSP